MSRKQAKGKRAVTIPATADQTVEPIVPASDIDWTERFYEGLGWRLDADFWNGTYWRFLQPTAQTEVFPNGNDGE